MANNNHSHSQPSDKKKPDSRRVVSGSIPPGDQSKRESGNPQEDSLTGDDNKTQHSVKRKKGAGNWRDPDPGCQFNIPNRGLTKIERTAADKRFCISRAKIDKKIENMRLQKECTEVWFLKETER